MDKELQAKWVAALRSGKYQQARGTLSTKGGGMCCLGVLLDISGLGHWDGPGVYTVRDDDGEHDLEADLCHYGPVIGIGDVKQNTLVHMNDGEREYKGHAKSFAEIADWIEKNL